MDQKDVPMVYPYRVKNAKEIRNILIAKKYIVLRIGQMFWNGVIILLILIT